MLTSGRATNRPDKSDEVEMKFIEDVENFIKEKDIVQCLIADRNYDKIKNLRSEIDKVKGVEVKNQHISLTNINAPREGTIYYDIAKKDTCKGVAVTECCKDLNIELKNVIAIGDSFNDIPMFKVVGHSVVMGNASDKVKKYADEIVDTNDNFGAAKFFEKLVAMQ